MEYQIEREEKEVLGDFKPELIPDECGGDIDDYEEALHVLDEIRWFHVQCTGTGFWPWCKCNCLPGRKKNGT